VFSADHAHVARAMRQGTNDLIQSPASDVMLTALICLDEYLLEQGLRANPILTVHDSVLLDCHRDDAEKAIRALSYIMENIHEYIPAVWGEGIDLDFVTKVPIKADVEVGVDWRDMVKVDAHAKKMDLGKAITKSIELRNQQDATLMKQADIYTEETVRGTQGGAA
jgi:hypothetical protein